MHFKKYLGEAWVAGFLVFLCLGFFFYLRSPKSYPLFFKVSIPLAGKGLGRPYLMQPLEALGGGVGLKYLPLCYCRSELQKRHC